MIKYRFSNERWCELPITNMFDHDAQETTDKDKAVALVARLPNGEWLAAKCVPDEISYAYH